MRNKSEKYRPGIDMSQTKRVFESAFIPYYTHNSSEQMTDKPELKELFPKPPDCYLKPDKKPKLKLDCSMVSCGWNIEKGCNCPCAESRYYEGYEQGKLDQYNQTIALLYNLRTNRFIYNDEMKQAIDMIKDEITRRFNSKIKEKEGEKR